jgi:hypothetical protein
MKKIIIVCLTSLFVVFSLNLTAQSFFDVARLDVIQIPTSYKGDGQSFDVREVSGALNLGFKTVGEDRLLLSWNGERRCIHLDGEAPYQKPLFLNVASLGYIRSWPESPWRLLMMSRLKLGSDYDILTSEDLSWAFWLRQPTPAKRTVLYYWRALRRGIVRPSDLSYLRNGCAANRQSLFLCLFPGRSQNGVCFEASKVIHQPGLELDDQFLWSAQRLASDLHTHGGTHAASLFRP